MSKIYLIDKCFACPHIKESLTIDDCFWCDKIRKQVDPDAIHELCPLKDMED